jgi:hypothetical protein
MISIVNNNVIEYEFRNKKNDQILSNFVKLSFLIQMNCFNFSWLKFL